MIRLFKKKPLSYSDYLIEQGLYLQQKRLKGVGAKLIHLSITDIEYKDKFLIGYYLDYLETIGYERLSKFIEQEIDRYGYYWNECAAKGIKLTIPILIDMIARKFKSK